MHRKADEKVRKTPKKSKYNKRLSLKSKLFLYLCVLCVFTISLLWIFQMVLLDDFYYYVTLDSLSDAAGGYDMLSEDKLQSYTDTISSEENVYALVCSEKGDKLAESASFSGSMIRYFSPDKIQNIYEKTEEHGGTYIFTFDFSDIAIDVDSQHSSNQKPTTPEQQIPDGIAMPNNADRDGYEENRIEEHRRKLEDDKVKRLIYTKIVRSASEGSYLVMFDCSLTPLDTVTDTIMIQLIIVSIIIVALSLLLALIFSHKVTKPISNISNNAKLLARGRYDVNFEGGGCKEIDELSDTLSYACTELSKLENLQNELISNISHDLRTPLTMINGYAEVMRDIPGENTPENVQVIIDETQRLSSLVNNLLEVSRAQQNAKVINKEVFSLTELLEQTVARFEKLNECKGYSFTLDAKENVSVSADREKISQVLYNLIGNAVNYTGKDKRVIITQTTAASVVRIDVYDTGDGIEAEKLPQIWQRYYRADAYHKRSELGMGIGLSIVKDILDAHKAAFGVNSKLGQGSDFWFKLHIVKKQNDRQE